MIHLAPLPAAVPELSHRHGRPLTRPSVSSRGGKPDPRERRKSSLTIHVFHFFLYTAIPDQIHQDPRHMRREQLARNAGNPWRYCGRNSCCPCIAGEIWIWVRGLVVQFPRGKAGERSSRFFYIWRESGVTCLTREHNERTFVTDSNARRKQNRNKLFDIVSNAKANLHQGRSVGENSNTHFRLSSSSHLLSSFVMHPLILV